MTTSTELKQPSLDLPLQVSFSSSLTMAWRNQGITGSNNIPLGRRRFGGDDPQDDDSRTATPASNVGDGGFKRGRSPVRGMLLNHFLIYSLEI